MSLLRTTTCDALIVPSELIWYSARLLIRGSVPQRYYHERQHLYMLITCTALKGLFMGPFKSKILLNEPWNDTALWVKHGMGVGVSKTNWWINDWYNCWFRVSLRPFNYLNSLLYWQLIFRQVREQISSEGPIHIYCSVQLVPHDMTSHGEDQLEIAIDWCL